LTKLKEDIMNAQHPERRAQAGTSSGQGSTTADIVRLGMAIQESSGTVSAIEYLKANGIGGPVIQRVLSGTAVRAEDTGIRRHTNGVVQA
jgi:hypothetical protein